MPDVNLGDPKQVFAVLMKHMESSQGRAQATINRTKDKTEWDAECLEVLFGMIKGIHENQVILTMALAALHGYRAEDKAKERAIVRPKILTAPELARRG